jgi:segregation and condensation protein A
MTAGELELTGFRGTLAELVSEVRRRAIDVLAVPIAFVTKTLLGNLRAREPVDAPALADFCDDASKLVLAKSRALLPREREREDDETEDDVRELEARLAAYRRYREAADALHEREEAGLRAYPRTAPPPAAPPPELATGELTPADLAAAFRSALASLPPEPEPGPGHLRPHRVRIGDRLNGLKALLRSRRRITFLEALSDGPRTREFVIVSFLAVLELLRREAIRVSQDQLFGEIVLEVRSDQALEEVSASGTFLEED